MKKAASIFVSMLFVITTAIAAPDNSTDNGEKSSKKSKTSHKLLITDQINNMMGYPNDLLNGNSQSVLVAYELDANNTMHVKEISTSNVELKEYVMKHIDGRKIKHAQLNPAEGVIKIHFVASEEQKYFIQY